MYKKTKKSGLVINTNYNDYLKIKKDREEQKYRSSLEKRIKSLENELKEIKEFLNGIRG